MFTFEEVSSSVRGGIPQLIDRLEPLRHEEPWMDLEAEQRINSLPGLIDLACTLALSLSAEDGLCRRMLESAALHGYTRRTQGLSDIVLLRELAVIRQAIWMDLQERYGNDCDVVAEVILRIDRAFSLAFQGSLRGYFRTEFEGLGSWPEAVTVLEADWLAPGVPSSAACHRGHRWAARPGKGKARSQRCRRTRQDGSTKLPQLPNSPS